MLGSAPLMGQGLWSERVSRWVLWLACAWFTFAAAWGMFGIPGDGHIGAGSAGNIMAAEQIVKWKIPYPALEWYSNTAPSKASYLCHHPEGQYYFPAIFVWIFGHRDFVVHITAVLMSVAMPPMLYGIAKERWGVAMGAVAAASYTVVPIAVGFASFTNLETITIFGVLLFFWGHSIHMRTGRTRHLVASLAGIFVACSGDWVGYLIVGPVLAWACLRAWVLPTWATPWFRRLPYARWWALSVSIAAVTLLYWVVLFQHADMLKDWLAAGTMRASGNEMPLKEVLHSRKAWIYFSFTPLAITLGKWAAPICVLRLFVTRRDEEVYAPAILLGAVIQYVKFKEGADVHIFWPHYFAPYFALALAQLAGAIASTAAWVAGRLSHLRPAPVAAAVGLVVGLTPVAAMAHDGVASLWVWRRTGGRYDDNGTLIHSHIDALTVMQDVVVPHTPHGATLDVHPSLQWYWQYLWKLQSDARTVMAPVAGSQNVATHPFWAARSSGMTSDEVRRIPGSAHVRVYGSTWIVDQREPPAPVDVYSMNEHEPNIFEWLVYGGTEPSRTIGTTPDPWLTWELRAHIGQAAPIPTGEPHTPDEIRIAYNVAIARSDGAEAARLRTRIDALLDRTKAVPFDHGVNLIGVRVAGSAEPKVETWFECTSPMGDLSFNVRSTMVARGRFSLIPPDPTDREMALGPLLPTKLWRPGMIYSTYAVANHRIGVERYWGYWGTRDGSPPPHRIDGQQETTLATLD